MIAKSVAASGLTPASGTRLGVTVGAVVYWPKTAGSLSMKIFGAAFAVALLVAVAWPTAPARAQSSTPSINLLADQPSKSPEEVEKEEAQQKAYKESLKKIPDAKASTDPWGTVRSVDTSKDTPKERSKAVVPAKPKTKTGSTQTKTETR
jgi:hypothetical protein